MWPPITGALGCPVARMAALHWHKWEKDEWSKSDEKDNAERKKGLAEISRDCFDEQGEIGYRQLLLAVLFCCNISVNG